MCMNHVTSAAARGESTQWGRGEKQGLEDSRRSNIGVGVWSVVIFATCVMSYISGCIAKAILIKTTSSFVTFPQAQGKQAVVSRPEQTNSSDYQNKNAGGNNDRDLDARTSFMESQEQRVGLGQPYVEALVHPGMFAHTSPPRRVVLIDPIDGTVLREVLKHAAVEQVTVVGGFVIDIQEDNVISSTYLKSTLDCGDLVGVPNSCINDPRVTLSRVDASTWMRSHYIKSSMMAATGTKPSDSDLGADGDQGCSETEERTACKATDGEMVDVLIVCRNGKLLSHKDELETFWDLALRILTKDGVAIAELGPPPFRTQDVEADKRMDWNKIIEASTMQDTLIQSLHVYEESHGYLSKPQAFMVLCRSADCRVNWFADDAIVNLNIHKRMGRTTGRRTILRSFDGAKMQGYQHPPIAWQAMQCRAAPDDCEVIDWDRSRGNVRNENFEVKMSSLGESVGRGLFTKVDIPAGTYMFQDAQQHNVKFRPHNYDLIKSIVDMGVSEIEPMDNYMEGYGYESDMWGGSSMTVDSSYGTFVNHGCNGTFNFGPVTNADAVVHLTEETAQPSDFAESSKFQGFDPLGERHLEHYGAYFDGAFRDIAAGEEIFANYAAWATSTDAETILKDLRSECRGDTVGLVVAVDHGKSKS